MTALSEQFRTTFVSLYPPPIAADDATHIIEIAQIVVDLDGREGPDEIKVFFSIGKHLFGDAEIPTFASDEEDDTRMFDLATELKSTAARELAYAIARVLAAADLEIAPAEESFIDRLRGVLSIDKTRAATIATMLRG